MFSSLLWWSLDWEAWNRSHHFPKYRYLICYLQLCRRTCKNTCCGIYKFSTSCEEIISLPDLCSISFFSTAVVTISSFKYAFSSSGFILHYFSTSSVLEANQSIFSFRPHQHYFTLYLFSILVSLFYNNLFILLDKFSLCYPSESLIHLDFFWSLPQQTLPDLTSSE